MKTNFFNRPLKDLIAAAVFLFVCLFLVFAGIWAYKTFMSSPPYVDPERYPVRGIDISAHNGNVDMERVAADGYEFVFIKATEGVDFKDRNFRVNYDKAEKAGLKTGIYHFFRFDRDGVEQALNLLKAVGKRRPDLGIVIDVEKAGNPDSIPKEKIQSRLTHMVEYLNLLGHRVMFYSNRDGYYEYLADAFPGAPLWICGFSENPIHAEWSFWQFNHRGEVDGIEGDVDLNAFCGSREEWQNFLEGDIWPYSDKD
ncbi:MAG: hypothetical protein K1W02_00990 [Muribaculaceae bacterium]